MFRVVSLTILAVMTVAPAQRPPADHWPPPRDPRTWTYPEGRQPTDTAHGAITRNADGSVTVHAARAGVQVDKTVWEGKSELAITYRDTVTRVRLAGETATVTLGGRTMQVHGGSSREAHVELRKALVADEGVEAYRQLLGEIEQQDRMTYAEEGLLLDGVVLAVLSGDGSAIARHQQGIVRRGQFRRIQYRDCMSMYYSAIMSAFSILERCNRDAAYSYFPPGHIWACQASYLGRSQSAWWQFVSCSTIPIR